MSLVSKKNTTLNMKLHSLKVGLVPTLRNDPHLSHTQDQWQADIYLCLLFMSVLWVQMGHDIANSLRTFPTTLQVFVRCLYNDPLVASQARSPIV